MDASKMVELKVEEPTSSQMAHIIMVILDRIEQKLKMESIRMIKSPMKEDSEITNSTAKPMKREQAMTLTATIMMEPEKEESLIGMLKTADIGIKDPSIKGTNSMVKVFIALFRCSYRTQWKI